MARPSGPSDPNLDQNYDIFVGTILAFNANVLHAPNRVRSEIRKDPSVTLFFGRTSLSNRNIVLAILLLAGDVHPNPGPINRETIYPCGYCQQHVGWSCSGVGCETCNVWYHRECVSITHSHYLALNNSAHVWICFKCQTPNFSNSSISITGSPEINFNSQNSFAALSDLTGKDDPLTTQITIDPLGSSDHATIYFNIITEPKNIKREKIVYFYNKGNYREMCKKVSEYDWSNILEKSKHIDEQWESFAELITNAQETHIPHKTIDMNKNKSNSWKVPRTKEMKIIGSKRDRKWTRYMETGNLNHYKEFCSYRNKVKKLSKVNRKEYEATLASEAKSNPKAVYKYINKRLNIQKETTEIHVNSESTESRITEDNDLILDTFSKYFASIFTKDDNNHLPTIDISPCKSEMNEFLVTERMVSEQIRKLDITKSAGPDNINARVT